ncbi:hypothetical protein [Deinococcus pimensis]|uniref:hypothetical protein n=1 Tax=Deinococcus pimensis TaxID=309888 RepID=UPI00048391C9|nr:hypothetical protein [Deinococcus pimensis]
MERPLHDIVSLRLCHCRAESAVQGGALHIAVLHYRTCLEAAERREDVQAQQFFASRLGECYDRMGMREKAAGFRAMANPPKL